MRQIKEIERLERSSKDMVVVKQWFADSSEMGI